MAASLQNHFHLMLTAPVATESTGEWTAMAPGMKPVALPEYYVAAVPRRALNGTLRSHVLKSGSTPILFTDWTIQVKVDDQASLTTWSGYLGKTMYFVPHWHDPVLHTSYDQLVYVEKVDRPSSPGPTMPVYYLLVHLIDSSI